MMKRLLSILTIICSCCMSMPAQDANGIIAQAKEKGKTYMKSDDPQVADKLSKWQDLKFGVLFHWGIYSVPGIVESWSLMSWDNPWQYGPRQNLGMTYNEYKKWYFSLSEQFNPVNFNPDEWADIMNDAGMKYMIFTSKHHDGFCMYDSKLTNYGVAHGPYRKNKNVNIMGCLFKSFRDRGFMVGPYFSKPDWHCEWYWNPMFSTGKTMDANYDPENHPDWWAKYKEFVAGQVREVTMDNGHVDMLWLDGSMSVPYLGIDNVITEARKKNPGMLCIDRGQTNKWADYLTPERQIPENQPDYPWESCIQMTRYWSYRANDNKYKTGRQLLNILIEIVAKGGNMLLGVGPTPDGRIEDAAVKSLREVGRWLKINGRAIYNTRPTKNYNDGKTWFTADKDGHTMYAIYAMPEDAHLPGVIRWIGNIPKGEMRLLDGNREVRYNVKGDVVSVILPKDLRNDNLVFVYNMRKK